MVVVVAAVVVGSHYYRTTAVPRAWLRGLVRRLPRRGDRRRRRPW